MSNCLEKFVGRASPAVSRGASASLDTKFCFKCNKLKFQLADNPDLLNRKPKTANC